MKKPLVVLAGALLLAVLCAYLYSLVQPVAESDTLKVQWHAGGGVRGVVTGKFQDAHGKPIPHQTFKRMMTVGSRYKCPTPTSGPWKCPDPRCCSSAR